MPNHHYSHILWHLSNHCTSSSIHKINDIYSILIKYFINNKDTKIPALTVSDDAFSYRIIVKSEP